MATTTIATASSSTPTMASPPSQSSDPEPSLFRLAGSPALVLAFLAVGILAGGLVSVLFFRRLALIRLMRQREAAALAAGDGAGWTRGPLRSRAPLGPKPKLWDIECAPLAKGRDVRGWGRVVPLAMSYEQPLIPPVLVEDTPANPSAHKLLPSTNALGRWVRGLASSPPEQPKIVPSVVRLRVAVTVAMPEAGEEDQRGRDHRSQMPIYALGLTDIVWEADAIDSLISVLPSSSSL